MAAFIPGQSLLSRTAYVGLDNVRFGRLKLGNQYDFMVDSPVFSFDVAVLYTGRSGANCL